MTIKEFRDVCDSRSVEMLENVDFHPLLKSLYLEHNGDWDSAHNLAQDDFSKSGSAVHAYLHRVEGVQWNAEYWYKKAGKSPFRGSLKEEWTTLASELLSLHI